MDMTKEVSNQQETNQQAEIKSQKQGQTMRNKNRRDKNTGTNKSKPIHTYRGDTLHIHTDRRDNLQPAAPKVRESDVYHEIEKITRSSQAAGCPIRVEVRFIDGDIRWLPLECLNTQAVTLYRSLNLKVYKVRNLRTRK